MIKLKNLLVEGYFEVTATGVDKEDTRFSKSGVDRRDSREGEAGAGFSYTTLVKANNENDAKKKALQEPRLKRMARQNGVSVKDLELFVSKTTSKQGLGEEAGNKKSDIKKYIQLADGKLEEAKMYLQMVEREFSSNQKTPGDVVTQRDNSIFGGIIMQEIRKLDAIQKVLMKFKRK